MKMVVVVFQTLGFNVTTYFLLYCEVLPWFSQNDGFRSNKVNLKWISGKKIFPRWLLQCIFLLLAKKEPIESISAKETIFVGSSDTKSLISYKKGHFQVISGEKGVFDFPNFWDRCKHPFAPFMWNYNSNLIPLSECILKQKDHKFLNTKKLRKTSVQCFC